MKDEEDEQTIQLNKQMASEQKSALQQLYLDRNRPLWKKDVTELNIVTKPFLEEWRAFLRYQMSIVEFNISDPVIKHSVRLYVQKTMIFYFTKITPYVKH